MTAPPCWGMGAVPPHPSSSSVAAGLAHGGACGDLSCTAALPMAQGPSAAQGGTPAPEVCLPRPCCW